MKVYPCTDSKPEQPTLSFEEIQKEEGVYREADSHEAFARDRLIVVHNNGDPAVLWFNTDDKSLHPASAGSWRTGRFIKTTERVCMEIKP